MHAVTLVLAASLSAAALATQDPETPPSPTEVYRELHAAGDQDGLVTFWRENPGRVLYTIDADLEGSLALWEAGRDGESGEVSLDEATSAAIALHHERALFGARAAVEAFDRPIFLDYTASFVSWGAAEKLDFRAGQAAFGEAMQAMGAGDLEAAVAAGERCTALAEPLGDWWGTSMGLGISGAAKLQLEDPAGALTDLSKARLLDQALGLVGSERRSLEGMLDACEALGRTARAIACCEALIAMTEGPPQAEFEERLAKLRGA